MLGDCEKAVILMKALTSCFPDLPKFWLTWALMEKDLNRKEASLVSLSCQPWDVL